MITYAMIEKKIDRLVAEGAKIYEFSSGYFNSNVIGIGNIYLFEDELYINDKLIDIDELDKKSLREKLNELCGQQEGIEHTVEEIIKYLES